MRILFACMILLFMVGNTYSQQTQKEFIPSNGNFFPYVNSYSSSEGLKQFYFEDSQWVRNYSIPDFTDKDKYKNLSLQYIAGDSINPPQLFAYSQVTGDFSFYFLTSDSWILNSNMPSGKIGLTSKNIISKYTPASEVNSSFVFSYSSDDSIVEFLEFTDQGWDKVDVISGALPQN